MANKDLRSFLEIAYKNHEVVEVEKELDPKFQATAVIEKLEKENKYPAVLFKHLSGSAMPVVSNLFSKRKRLAMALGCSEKDLNATYREREDKRVEPVMVEKAPVQEIVLLGDDIDVTKLPNITHNALDAGPYITCGASVVRDIETGIRNVGVYRHQVHGKNKIGIHMSEVSHVNIYIQ
jgi:2,5-furandicarboxylate decarboxylase 1